MALEKIPDLIPNARDDDNSPSKSHLAEYYSRFGMFLDQSLEEAVAIQADVPELKEMKVAFDYLMGLQWKEQMPSYRAKPVSNEMLSMFWETVGLLTDIRPMFSITDIGADNDYSPIQSILNKLAKGWVSTSHFQQRYAFCIMFAMMTSTPAKIYWNPFARGHSGSPEDGDLSLECVPPNDLLRLGIGDHLQDDECVIHRKVRTINWIKRAYPKMGTLVKPEASYSKYNTDSQGPIDLSPRFVQPMSGGMRRLLGAEENKLSDSMYPKATVYEFWMKDDSVNESRNIIWMGPKGAPWGYWVKPGDKMYPRGRLVVRANRVILYDEPNPYYHRKFPFALLGLSAVPWQTYAMSVVSPWMKQQDILNQIMYGLVQSVKKAINPPLTASKSSLNPEAMRAIDSSKPGLKITYNSMGQPPVWGQPPNIPPYVQSTYGMVLKSMQQSSGAAAVNEASGKKQVPGGDTLDRINFAKNTNVRLMGRNSEDFLDEIGEMWTGDALQFYTAERRIELLGGKGLVPEDTDARPGSLIPEGIDSEAFVRRWKFKSDRGTLLNVQQQERLPVAFALRKGRDLSRPKLFEMLNWNINQKENDAELLEEAKQMAAMMPPKPGKGHK